MDFWKPETDFYCGVDLHWGSMHVCIIGKDGEKKLHRKLRNDGPLFLRILERYRPSITVSCESSGSWWWLADLCQGEGIPFAPGHVLYMRAIHGARTKNDAIDSYKIALLTKGGMLPKAYAHPRELRATRDLLRRRAKFVHHRGGLMTHVRALNAQGNLDALGRISELVAAPELVESHFTDPDVRTSVRMDLDMIAHYGRAIAQIEERVRTSVHALRGRDVAVLCTAPGVGDVLSLTMLLEIHTVARFESHQRFASYSRVVRCAHESNGKACGAGNPKIGNPYLRWALGEVVVLASQADEKIAALRERLERRHGPAKGKAILAHKFARAFYYMLKNGTAFDEGRFLSA